MHPNAFAVARHFGQEICILVQEPHLLRLSPKHRGRSFAKTSAGWQSCGCSTQ